MSQEPFKAISVYRFSPFLRVIFCVCLMLLVGNALRNGQRNEKWKRTAKIGLILAIVTFLQFLAAK